MSEEMFGWGSQRCVSVCTSVWRAGRGFVLVFPHPFGVCSQDCVPRQRIKKVANLRNQGKKEAACCGNTLRNDWAPGKNLNSDRKGKKGREIQALSCSVLQPVNIEVSIS